jgi:hypothetical protein
LSKKSASKGEYVMKNTNSILQDDDPEEEPEEEEEEDYELVGRSAGHTCITGGSIKGWCCSHRDTPDSITVVNVGPIFEGPSTLWGRGYLLREMEVLA